MTTPSHALNARKQPRQSRSVSTVDAILEAAARILEGGGLNALNTNAVAELAGVSVATAFAGGGAGATVVGYCLR